MHVCQQQLCHTNSPAVNNFFSKGLAFLARLGLTTSLSGSARPGMVEAAVEVGVEVDVLECGRSSK